MTKFTWTNWENGYKRPHSFNDEDALNMEVRRSSLILVLIMILSAFNGLIQLGSTHAQGSDVSGFLSDDTTWTLENSPYMVVGSVIVQSGVTLTIEPGVQLRIGGPRGMGAYTLYVRDGGFLKAVGSEDSRINITSDKETPSPGDWGSIQIQGGGHAEITYADISYAESAIRMWTKVGGTIENCNIFGSRFPVQLNSNHIVANNTFSYNEYGIHVGGSNNTVRDNHIYWHDMDGVYLDLSSNNTITSNTIISGNSRGIDLRHSHNNTISHNFVFSSSIGLKLTGSWNNIILNNTISKSWKGMVLGSSVNTEIIGNLLTNNDRGISVTDSSGTLIVANTIFSSEYHGIRLDWDGPATETCVYHNNIIDNGEQAYDGGESNLWNDSYPSGGNYWSDYTGIDLNGTLSQDTPPPDGLGDIPYEFHDNMDKYPLMDPWPFAPDIERSRPPKPEGLTATVDAESNQVNLSWEKNEEPDVELYMLYKSDSEDGPYTSLWELHQRECGETECSITDTWVDEGRTYWYYVVAVNLMGNDSPDSNKVNATMPGPETKPDDDTSADPWIIIWLVIGALIVIAAVLIVILVRRKRQSK